MKEGLLTTLATAEVSQAWAMVYRDTPGCCV
jgi:hypothetical protein